jgi:hypothetical protein
MNRYITNPFAENVRVSKQGIKVSNWEYNETVNKVRAINTIKRNERERVLQIEATDRGKPLGLTRAEMGSQRINELKPKKFNFDKIRPGKEWEKFKQTLEKMVMPKYTEQQMAQYKYNYIQAMLNVFGNDALDLFDTIVHLDPEVFIRTYYQEEQASIDFIYDPVEQTAKLEILTEIWENAADSGF